jgi:hypothetical protein
MIDWTRGITNLKDKFLALPIEERALIIHNVINIHGLSAPRPKAWKQLDAVGVNKKLGTYRKQLFQCVASKHLFKYEI